VAIVARRVGDDFGVAVGEFPAPPDLVVIGDVAFGAGFFAIDFGTRSFGGDRCFGGDLGVAARRVGDDFGDAVGEFPAPPDLVVIGDIAFGAGFFAIDFGARSFGGDRCFGGDLGDAARRVGDDFGVAVGEFPAPPDLVVIGDMVS
jgi:hypothetical protein